MLVIFDDLSDQLKVRAWLRLGSGKIHPIAGRLRMLQYLLQRIPVNPFSPQNLALDGLSPEDLKPYPSPLLRLSVHHFLSSGST
jgi:hypothetical protein